MRVGDEKKRQCSGWVIWVTTKGRRMDHMVYSAVLSMDECAVRVTNQNTQEVNNNRVLTKRQTGLWAIGVTTNDRGTCGIYRSDNKRQRDMWDIGV